MAVGHRDPWGSSAFQWRKRGCVDRLSDAEERFFERERDFTRLDSVSSQLEHLNGLRVAVPTSLVLFLVLAWFLLPLGSATGWWTGLFVGTYCVGVAVNEAILRRKLPALRSCVKSGGI